MPVTGPRGTGSGKTGSAGGSSTHPPTGGSSSGGLPSGLPHGPGTSPAKTGSAIQIGGSSIRQVGGTIVITNGSGSLQLGAGGKVIGGTGAGSGTGSSGASGGSSSGTGSSGGGSGGGGGGSFFGGGGSLLAQLRWPTLPGGPIQRPTIQSSADWIRTKFFAALGDLSGYPYNLNLRTDFYCTGSVQINGQAGVGLDVVCTMYTINQGDGSKGTPVATGQAQVVGGGFFQIDCKGAYDITAEYIVEIDVTDGTNVDAFRQFKIGGYVAYSQGVQATFDVGTEFVLEGKVTLDGSPTAGAWIQAHLEQQDPTGGTVAVVIDSGWVESASDGTYQLKVAHVYDATGGPASSFSYHWTVSWGAGDIAHEVGFAEGAIDGATLVAGPITWNPELKTSDGQVSGGTGTSKIPPTHHQKNP